MGLFAGVAEEIADEVEEFVGFVGGEVMIGPSALVQSGWAEIDDRRVGLGVAIGLGERGAIVFRTEAGGEDKAGEAGTHQAKGFGGFFDGMRGDDVVLGGFQYELAGGKGAVGFVFCNEKGRSHELTFFAWRAS